MVKFLCLVLFFFFSLAHAALANTVEANKPYSYELLEQNLQDLNHKFQNQLEIKPIGTSPFGRKIWAVKLGKGEKSILFIGSHHAREWLTSTLLMKMLETYASAYAEEKSLGNYSTDILNEVSIWFVPMLNPDGVAIQQNNLSGFSPQYQRQLQKMNDGLKNFKRWKANAMGIDLNRQYPAGWTELSVEPSSPSYKGFKGKKPVEASEVVSLTKFVEDIHPIIAVAYHTAGREIFWKYKNGKNLFRDYFIAKKVSKLTGYTLSMPDQVDAVGGGFTDWFITRYHRPAMTIEISYLVGEKNPPLSVFREEWKRNKYVGLKLAEEAKKLLP